MNDRQLISFLKIVETGSFSKAAQDSFISVPAIVQQIDRLEESLEFRLFSRTNQGILLTEDGKIFYEAVLEMQKTYKQALAKIKNTQKSSLIIGAASNQCPEFLMNACDMFQKKYPHIHIHFAELPYEKHLEMLRQRKIDMTVIAKPKNSELKGLTYKELCMDTCAFGINDEKQFSGKKQIQLKDLKGATILCGTYHYMEVSFKQLLTDSDADLQVIPDEYNLDSRAQAKFSNSILVFHSLWKNCYSHMFHLVSSDISAGSVGVVFRSGEEKRLENLLQCLQFQISDKSESHL